MKKPRLVAVKSLVPSWKVMEPELEPAAHYRFPAFTWQIWRGTGVNAHSKR